MEKKLHKKKHESPYTLKNLFVSVKSFLDFVQIPLTQENLMKTACRLLKALGVDVCNNSCIVQTRTCRVYPVHIISADSDLVYTDVCFDMAC